MFPVTQIVSWKQITNLNVNIEEEVIALFDEFLSLVTRNVYGVFHSSEVYKQQKVKGSMDSDTWKIINGNHAFCYYCNEHLYCFTDISDINSFFQKHINTNYHKSCRQINELGDSEPMFTWEEFGVTGHCHVCNMSGLNALVFDTRTDLKGLRSRHKCQCEIKYSKIDLFKRFCRLALFLQKFTYNYNGRSFMCKLCNWLLDSDDTVTSHFVSDHHMHKFLKLIESTFGFQMKDLLNGYHLELVFRWMLSNDVVINMSEPLLKPSSKENCLMVSNSPNKLYPNTKNSIEFTPKLISGMLSFNTFDFIVDNECLLCDQKGIQVNHIQKPTHEKNIENAHHIIKNSKNYTKYLENVAKRLRPFKEVIECYYTYKNYLSKNYPSQCEKTKTTTPDRGDPFISQTEQVNATLDEAIAIVEQKNHISGTKTVQKKEVQRGHSTVPPSNKPTNLFHSIKPIDSDSTHIKKNNGGGSKIDERICKSKKAQEDEGGKVTPDVKVIAGNETNILNTEKLPNEGKQKKKQKKRKAKGKSIKGSTTTAVTGSTPLKVKLEEDPQLRNSVETVVKPEEADFSIILDDIDTGIRDGIKLEAEESRESEGRKIIQKSAVGAKENSIEISNEGFDGGSPVQSNEGEERAKSEASHSGPTAEPAEKGSDEKSGKNQNREKLKKRKKQKSNASQNQTSNEASREKEHHDSGRAQGENTSKPKEVTILVQEKAAKKDGIPGKAEAKDKKTKADKGVDTIKTPDPKRTVTSIKRHNLNEEVLMIPDLPRDLRDNMELYLLFRKFGKIKEVVIENGQGFLVFEDPKTIQLIFDSRPIKFMEVVLELVATTRKESLNKEEKLHPIFVYYLSQPDRLMDSVLKTVKWISSPYYRENEGRREEFLCQKIIAAIERVYPRSRCYPFGSRVTGLSFDNSDLDVFLDCGDAYEGSENLSRKVNIIKLVWNIADLLYKKKHIFSQLNVVTRARVPIVSFFENETQLKCDLSFSNALSVQNTAMLKFMLSLDWRVQPLILIVKQWAIINHLHGRPLFSSYALSLMTVFYLQQISSPILPAVETLQKKFMGRRYTINGWDCNISKDVNLLPKVTNTDSILVLLMGFFEFYEKFGYEKFVISPLTGIPLAREALTTNITSLPMAYKRHYHNMPLHIIQKENSYIWCVDPFDLSHNVTSQFPEKEFKMFITFCKASVEHLKKSLKAET